jgi:predicted nucleic acid-binding protein
MTMLVVDASTVAKWFFPEEFSSQARRLLSPRRTLIAPDLIWSELGSIVWKRVRRGDISAREATELSADLVRIPVVVVPTQPLFAGALELAILTDRTVYDCMYLALAIERRCRLITADQRFTNALASSPLSKHIGHVSKIR